MGLGLVRLEAATWPSARNRISLPDICLISVGFVRTDFHAESQDAHGLIATANRDGNDIQKVAPTRTVSTAWLTLRRLTDGRRELWDLNSSALSCGSRTSVTACALLL